MKISDYQYQSCFGSFIEDFIQDKRAAGFIYKSEEWKLKHFDAFCIQEGITEPYLSKELVDKWGTMREGEEMVTCSSRVSIIRQFGLYMASWGKDAYIPRHFYKSAKTLVHVLSDEEIKAIFKIIDGYIPAINVSHFHRLALEYKVLFRLIYCCGLRISEARSLRKEDVDMDLAVIRILQSKGRKDRLVPLADDLVELLREYNTVMASVYNLQSEWFFPSRDPRKCLANCTIDKRFRDSWHKTPFATDCDKAPTVHCLRHSFVVRRMNLWMEQGIELKKMMPFLSKYLGHKSPEGTFYYYHQVDSAFRIVRKIDKSSARVIPEVESNE